MLKKYSSEDLQALTLKAQNSERLRTNLNIHEAPDAAVQRLFLAFEPDTYIRPHRHPEAHKWELFIVLQGELELLIFNDGGDIVERTMLSPDATRVVEIPPGTWHSYLCREPGTIALEVKQGEYLPTKEHDFLPMSPAENTPQAVTYYQSMKK
jgi:cupin fold WbuC family metalloprotein